MRVNLEKSYPAGYEVGGQTHVDIMKDTRKGYPRPFVVSVSRTAR